MHYDYIDKIHDGLIGEAGDELLRVISQWKVSADEVEVKAAELFNACVYYTTMAQRSNKQIRFDLMPMYTPASLSGLVEPTCCSALNAVPQSLVQRISRPASHFARLGEMACSDVHMSMKMTDGYTLKFVRGIATIAQMTKGCDENVSFKLIHQEDFLTIAHMIIDSVESFDKSAA
ncbi:hypothetical protein ACHAQJ_008461 [Trichoderma viride]